MGERERQLLDAAIEVVMAARGGDDSNGYAEMLSIPVRRLEKVLEANFSKEK